MRSCEYPVVFRSTGKHEYCGKPWAQMGVAGAVCDEHIGCLEVPVWYQDGLRYGWDEQHKDPSL